MLLVMFRVVNVTFNRLTVGAVLPSGPSLNVSVWLTAIIERQANLLDRLPTGVISCDQS